MPCRFPLAAVALLLGLAACDPITSLDVRQALAPAPAPLPSPRCVDSAFASSPHVGRAERVKSSGREADVRFNVVLLDSAPPGGFGATFTMRPAFDTASMSVRYIWLGRVDNVPAAQRAVMADAGARLLREVRARCAPTATAEPGCTLTSLFRTKRCGAGT